MMYVKSGGDGAQTKFMLCVTVSSSLSTYQSSQHEAMFANSDTAAWADTMRAKLQTEGGDFRYLESRSHDEDHHVVASEYSFLLMLRSSKIVWSP